MTQNLARPHGFESFAVEGTIPEGLRGTLYRAGPGLIERFGKPVHPFMADGAIHAVRFGVEVEGASRFVETEDFKREAEIGRPLTGPHAPLWRRALDILTGHIKSTGNTHLLPWQDELYALMEVSLPVSIDPNTLTTAEKPTNLGMIKTAFSAHPHRVSSLSTTFNFGARGKDIELFALPDRGPCKRFGTFSADKATLIHDFIVTEKHAIFFIDPTHLSVWRAALQVGDFSKWFSWDSSGNSTIVIIPLDEPERITRIDVPPFRVWHFVNAYEEGGNIVVDAIRHDDIGALSSPIDGGPEYTEPRLWRYQINLRTKQVEEHQLWNVACEFPRIHPADEGVRYDVAWVQTFDDDIGSQGFARFNLKTGTADRWHGPQDFSGSEPIFVPAPDNRDASGWVLQLMHSRQDGPTYLSVHDADRIQEGPVAKVWFPQALPPTFHGVFVPKKVRA